MINRFKLFKQITAVYSENQMKPINTLCWQNAEFIIVKAVGTYMVCAVYLTAMFMVQAL